MVAGPKHAQQPIKGGYYGYNLVDCLRVTWGGSGVCSLRGNERAYYLGFRTFLRVRESRRAP